MGFDQYYQFIDRTAVDPFLALTWPEFHKKYGWTGNNQWDSAADFLSDFALDGVEREDPAEVKNILAVRTLRWTLRHCSPLFFCLREGLLVHAPYVRACCPCIQAKCLDEVALFLAPATYGFLQGWIDQRTLWTVFALHGCDNQLQWLELPRKHEKAINAALLPSNLPTRMFPWQEEYDGHDSDGGHYCPLGLADTRRFMKFLRRAWDENWPCPYLPDLRYELPKGRPPTIRDCGAAETLLSCAPTGKGQRPCMYWVFV